MIAPYINICVIYNNLICIDSIMYCLKYLSVIMCVYLSACVAYFASLLHHDFGENEVSEIYSQGQGR